MKRFVWILLALLALVAWGIGSAVVSTSLVPVARLARAAPRETLLMAQRRAEASRAGRTYHVDCRWVSYERISPLLRHAVLVAEDDAFYSHDGLDWNEIRAAAKKDWTERRVARGGSTVTQQLAKNLWLGTERTPTRKLKEMLLALRMERVLTKRRILELYLNLIEWGDGVYGAEAAAQRYFGVSASQLDARQSVLLASVIINPRRYSPVHPSRRIERRAEIIASRMRRHGYLNEDQYALAIGQEPAHHGFLDWLFGPPHPEPPPMPDSAADSTLLEEEETPADTATIP